MQNPGTLGVGLALLLIVTGCSGESANEKPLSPLHRQLTASLRANGCSTCHSVDRKSMGPSMMAVAQRYGGDTTAAVAAAIRSGSQERWGLGRMPRQPQMSPAKIDAIASMIGQLEPEA